MKLNNLIIRLFFLATVVSFASCSNDDDPNPEQNPVDITADNVWVDGNIAIGEEIWYKVTCDAGSTTAGVEWSELDWPRKDVNYTADVKVSAYLMDGITPYFEDINDGYKLTDGSTTFDLAVGEVQFLIKVVVGPKATAGTFALRTSASNNVNIVYNDLAVEDNWTEVDITEGSTIGYKVKCTEGVEYQIIWAEKGTSGFSYTADVRGSVLNKDANAFYALANGGSGLFELKNKSYGDGDIKSIVALTGENNFKIHMKGIETGKFAIKVLQVTQ